jgi:uncharacterized membrane protein YhaH (DUF805 family)
VATNKSADIASFDWKYLFTSLEGRISRKPFWLGSLAILFGSAIVQLIVLNFAGEILSLLVGLALLYPSFAVAVKRAHDRNRPTWVIALFYAVILAIVVAPLAGWDYGGGEPSVGFLAAGSVFLIAAIALTIDLGFLRGTAGKNQFGPDPLQN